MHQVEVAESSIDQSSGNVAGKKRRLSYWNLLSEHPNYRMFLLSYFMTHCGEWLTYVASMSLLEQHSNSNSAGTDPNIHDGHRNNHHYLKISFLVVTRLLPNTLWSIPGGLLADSLDRKRVMVTIDLVSAVVALCYCLTAVPAVLGNQHQEDGRPTHYSIAVLYVCTVLQESLSGLYEPNRSAIVPQLVSSLDYIDKANAGLSVLWSLTAAVGASLGGFLTAQFGPMVCFVTDAVLYLVSAAILAWGVQGDFLVHTNQGEPQDHETGEFKMQQDHLISHDIFHGANPEHEATSSTATPQNSSTSTSIRRHKDGVSSLTMLRQLAHYLGTSSTGAYLLIKACGALLFGASDVVYTTFAENHETNSVNNATELDSQRLGWMFAAVGVGCLLGPLVLPDERSHLNYCIGSYAVLSVGYGMIGASPQYWQKCVWTVLRASGAAVLWIESSILIQTATPLSLLGRVSSIDLALALTGESVSALAAGLLEDGGWTADQVAVLLSGGGLLLACLWAIWSRQLVNRKYFHSRRVLLSKDSERVSPDDDSQDEEELELEPLRQQPR